jgi:hypothetical protein
METVEIKKGMKVVDSAGDFIGNIKDIMDTYFVVDRPMQQDISINRTAVAKADDIVTLNIDIPEVLRRRGQFPHM